MADKEFAKRFLDGTANYLPYVPALPDGHIVSPFCMKTIADYSIEHDAEYVRRKFFPCLPSRLSAIYAFGDYESCVLCNQKYGSGWKLDTVKEFNLMEVPNDPFTRVARVNMEVVSLARYAYHNASLDGPTREALWKHYWSGGGKFSMELPDSNYEPKIMPVGVIWEYLIEGGLQLKEAK